ncbi:four helix bundle protein [Flavobacterium sp. CYK-4]|uniref:four helix bundle protein n=1 Tax=Flavobacterium lotistagni TaxID=2709660 RepID=UPI0014084047|nr:four helix bundle protein [Flavobacterium lotistagni]NHM06230.1 four helix bundle protein [Flavobacterium lotistagni]
MKTFRDLLIWQKAMKLVTATYENTNCFPQSEIYGLTSQLRRCAVSIPSNIAEGYGRETKKELARYLSISIGSLYEYQTQIEIAKNINYLNQLEFNLLYENSRELEIMMLTFARKLNTVA